MKLKASIILAFVLMASVHAVAADAEPGSHRSPSSEGASVGFANISDGDVLPPTFIVRFSISGMGIAPAGVQIDNTGHHHLLIDVVEYPDFNLPLPANDQVRHFGKGQTEAEVKLAEGEHTLQVLLADHAHIPHQPPVMSDVITIVVSVDAPAQTENTE
jgi:hypothetical protein